MRQFHNPLAPKRNRFQAKSAEIKAWVRDALDLPEDTPISIAELACRDEGCPDIETVIGILKPDQPIVTFKLHHPISEITQITVNELLSGVGNA